MPYPRRDSTSQVSCAGRTGVTQAWARLPRTTARPREGPNTGAPTSGPVRRVFQARRAPSRRVRGRAGAGTPGPESPPRAPPPPRPGQLRCRHAPRAPPAGRGRGSARARPPGTAPARESPSNQERLPGASSFRHLEARRVGSCWSSARLPGTGGAPLGGGSPASGCTPVNPNPGEHAGHPL